MMDWVEDIEQLEALYGAPSAGSQRKVVHRLTPLYRKWIMTSRFCVLSTVGPDGTDGSPRGDDRPVVQDLDDQTLAMPDWRGNNRIDSLRNIVADERVSLMFMVPGSKGVVRVNGAARVTLDEGVRRRFEQKGRMPRSVIVVKIAEIYMQCSRALLRAGLWSRDDSAELPSIGDLLAEATDGDMGGAEYDADWRVRATKTLW